jgi:hypothetical protein
MNIGQAPIHMATGLGQLLAEIDIEYGGDLVFPSFDPITSRTALRFFLRKVTFK